MASSSSYDSTDEISIGDYGFGSRRSFSPPLSLGIRGTRFFFPEGTLLVPVTTVSDVEMMCNQLQVDYHLLNDCVTGMARDMDAQAEAGRNRELRLKIEWFLTTAVAIATFFLAWN